LLPNHQARQQQHRLLLAFHTIIIMGDAPQQPQQPSSLLTSLFGGGDSNDDEQGNKRVDDDDNSGGGLFHKQKSLDLHAKLLDSNKRTAAADNSSNNFQTTKKQAGGMKKMMTSPSPSHTVETVTAKSRADIIRFRTECARHSKVNDLIVERNVNEPWEAFCEEVASTIRLYGVAIARNVVDQDDANSRATGAGAGPKILDVLADSALQQRAKICRALSQRNLTWNEDCNNHEIVRFSEVVVRCKGRMDVLFDPYSSCSGQHQDKAEKEEVPPFWTNHAILNGIIDKILYGGAAADESLRPRLVYAGWILSEPGSADQPFHQDGIPLFPTGSELLPPYAINVLIPLQDTTVELGPTEFMLQSHRRSESFSSSSATSSSSVISPLPQRGDMLLYDYRVCHRGTSNLTNDNTLRSVLYLLYARPWFKEHLNFGTERLLTEKGGGE
jgi:Phytanoyl-CoA dioxygenase (PhyH)